MLPRNMFSASLVASPVDLRPDVSPHVAEALGRCGAEGRHPAAAFAGPAAHCPRGPPAADEQRHGCPMVKGLLSGKQAEST